MIIPTSLEGRPPIPAQIAAERSFDAFDLALLVFFGTALSVLVVAGVTLVLGEMTTYLLAKTERERRE